MNRKSIDAETELPPGLYIVATPIGNIEDITLRALKTLEKADIIACEDTRVSGKLTSYYNIPAPKTPYHDHNADEVRPRLIAALKEGKRVALISDAGMPLISDPGYKLVAQCAEEGIHVTCIPGASASLTGLVLAGLPTDRFFFAGFLPPKTTARQKALAALKAVPGTLVFYETGPRLAESLADMKAVLGDRPAAVARELTKHFEEVRRGRLSALVAGYEKESDPKGEIVVIVGAPEEDAEDWSQEAIDSLIIKKMKEGLSVKDAAAFVSVRSGAKKRDVYERALTLTQKKK